MQSLQVVTSLNLKLVVNNIIFELFFNYSNHKYSSGEAMAPTLNSKASIDPTATEKLLVRRLTSDQAQAVKFQDVLAYMRPAVSVSPHHIMVRRVTGLPGTQIPIEDDGYV